MKKIHNWEELSKVPPSATHHIQVDVDDDDSDYNTFWIVPNNPIGNTWEEEHYLSTHTFYGGDTTKEYTKLLQKCGFNVELISWEQQKEELNK